MIKTLFFDSEKDIYINHNNINYVTVQDENRLYVKMNNESVYILNMDIETFLNRVKEFEKEINN